LAQKEFRPRILRLEHSVGAGVISRPELGEAMHQLELQEYSLELGLADLTAVLARY